MNGQLQVPLADALKITRPDGSLTVRVTTEGRLRGPAVRLLVLQCFLAGVVGGGAAGLLGRFL